MSPESALPAPYQMLIKATAKADDTEFMAMTEPIFSGVGEAIPITLSDGPNVIIVSVVNSDQSNRHL